MNNGTKNEPQIVCSSQTDQNYVSKQQHTEEEKDYRYEKLRQLCTYEDAPNHLKFNPFIRDGYRRELPTWMCLESIFWWTNETVGV